MSYETISDDITERIEFYENLKKEKDSMEESKKIRKVNICGISHDVIYEKDKFQIDDVKFGYIDYANAKIYINEEIAEPLQIETLCNVIIHGILFHIGKQEISEDKNLVQALANAIYQSFDIKGIYPRLTTDRTGMIIGESLSNEQK